MFDRLPVQLFLLMAISLLLINPNRVFASAPTGAAQAPSNQQSLPGGEPTNQIIIKFKPEANINKLGKQQRDARLQGLSARAGIQLTYIREMSDDAAVLRLPDQITFVRSRGYYR